MTTTTKNAILPGLVGLLFIAGCGPAFDPASLIKSTRVVGARIEVQGTPDRATPMPGETANVIWLITSPEATPPLAWTLAACLPGIVGGNGPLRCLDTPLARFDGTASPPQISIPVPAGAALGNATSLVIYGQICAGVDSAPTFDPGTGLWRCTGGRGTTVSLDVPLQLGGDANHNPVADRAFTLDGQAWTSADDPCVRGPGITAGSTGHVIADTSDASDREAYTAFLGDPPVPVPARERLQVSRFTTAGKLESQFSFVEATDDRAAPTVDVTWDAPDLAEIPAGGMEVTFTFVTRDDRGGTDWTSRKLCVSP